MYAWYEPEGQLLMQKCQLMLEVRGKFFARKKAKSEWKGISIQSLDLLV